MVLFGKNFPLILHYTDSKKSSQDTPAERRIPKIQTDSKKYLPKMDRLEEKAPQTANCAPVIQRQ
jgi:hypothetical protein